MTEKPEVRIAGPEDEQEVYRLLLLGQAENAFVPADNIKVSYFVKRFLWAAYMPENDPGVRGVIAVIGPTGALQAISIVGICQFWYESNYHLEEYIVYVDPEYRKPRVGQPIGHAAAILDWLKNQSEITGLPLFTGVLSKDRTEAKCRLYQRKLTKIGENFCYLPKGYTAYSDQIITAVQLSSAA